MHDILSCLGDNIDLGQSSLRGTSRKLIEIARPDLFAALPDDSPAYLEPLVFLHFASDPSVIDLDQAVGAFVPANRGVRRVQIFTDDAGRDYVPNLGYVKCELRNSRVELDLGNQERILVCSTGGANLDFEIEPPRGVGATPIELWHRSTRALSSIFNLSLGREASVEIDTAASARSDDLSAALVLLKTVWPGFHDALVAVLRRLVLFSSSECNSFASPVVHGMAFLNVTLGKDEVFLLEDIAHQGGHTILTAAIRKPEDYFRPGAECLLDVARHDDTRSPHVALHGLITEGFITVCLDECLRQDLVRGGKRHELKGRLAFIARRFGLDAKRLCQSGVLSEKGEKVARPLLSMLRELISRRRVLLTDADFSNQGYNFDYEKYASRNPEALSRSSEHGFRPEPRRRDGTAVAIENTSTLGFGCYRIVAGQREHAAALVAALDLGCTLVDTACNYGEGRSEELVGDVLEQHPAGGSAFVVTKVGYVTHSAESRLHAAGIDVARLPRISEESRYSLDVDVLREELRASRRRLRRRSHNAVLLHNPEHLFSSGLHERAGDRRQATARRALEFLEELVAAGDLSCYGVSSNVLATSEGMSIEEWLEIARGVSVAHHFRLVQFPFNLLEADAAGERNGRNLIQRIKALDLISIGNRPLTSRNDTGPVRMALSDEARAPEPGGVEQDLAAYEACVDEMAEQLERRGLAHKPMEFMVMQFLRDSRNGIEHPDLVDTIFDRHVYPLVNQLWDSGDSTGHDVFSHLQVKVRQQSVRRLDQQARRIRAQLVDSGAVLASDGRTFAVIACDYAFRCGIDRVVVGMRHRNYVECLRTLLPGRAGC